MNKYTLCSQIKEITSFEFSKFEINFKNYGLYLQFPKITKIFKLQKRRKYLRFPNNML